MASPAAPSPRAPDTPASARRSRSRARARGGCISISRSSLELDQRYKWTFFYKTGGANAVWAQIGDAAFNNVVLFKELAGTNGVWTQRTFTFTYTNARADLVRFISNAVGTFWVDELSVRETAP
jgi:hypothetical protein